MDAEPGASLLLLPVLIAHPGRYLSSASVWAVATLNVFYRDVQHIVTVALMLLFYMTPVFYRTDEVGAGLPLDLSVEPDGRADRELPGSVLPGHVPGNRAVAAGRRGQRRGLRDRVLDLPGPAPRSRRRFVRL